MKMSPEFIFNIFYFLISFGLIYPPNEFISAGFTIPNWFAGVLGSEHEQFVKYHIKKSLLNLLVYASLPLLYIMLLYILGFVNTLSELAGEHILWKMFGSTSLVLPLMALFEIKKWTDNNFEKHPIVQNLSKFCNNNMNWEAVASQINMEFRSMEKVCIKTNPISTVISTSNWILKVTPLTIFLAHQSDANLVVKEAATYQASHIESGETQFLNIEVQSRRTDPFTIRINAAHFKDLQDSLDRLINVLPEVKFHKSVLDRFIDVFKETIGKNPPYSFNMELDQCIGCLQANPSIKINKQCQDIENRPNVNCTNCLCRPMWCVDCIAKWFVTKQDPDQRSQWLSSKCTCPMCRATFCVLDVCPLAQAEE